MFKMGDVIRIGEGVHVLEYVGVVLRAANDPKKFRLTLSGLFEVVVGNGVVDEGVVGEWNFTDSWVERLTKIGEGNLYVGQRVVIREDSMHYGVDINNPKNVEGTISEYRTMRTGYHFRVDWDNGTTNVYRTEDLEVVTKAPKPKPRKKGDKSPGILAQISKAVEVLHSYDDYPTASYVIVFPKELPRRRESNTACHNGLRTEREGARLVVSCVKRGIDEYPWFYKWLIDESPWSSAFYRRYAWSKKNKCVAVRTNIAANFMFGALFATRVWENPEAMEFVKSFKNKLPISFLYAISKGVTINGREFSIHRARGGHWPFEHSPSKEVVKNFVLGTPKTLSETYSKSGNAPLGSVNECFGESNHGHYWLFEASQEDESAEQRKGLGGTRAFFNSKEKFLKFLTKQYEEVMK